MLSREIVAYILTFVNPWVVDSEIDWLGEVLHGEPSWPFTNSEDADLASRLE